MRLIFTLLLLFGSLTTTAGQGMLATDTAVTVVDSSIYPLEITLFDTNLVQATALRERYAGGYFSIYSFTSFTEADWSRFQPAFDPRLKVFPAPRERLPDYYFYLLLLVFLVLVFSINRDFNYFQNMFRATANYRLSLQVAREQVANRTPASVAYTLIFNMLFALFLIRLLEMTNHKSLLIDFEGAWLLLFLSITLVYLFKYAFYKFLGKLFGLREQVSYYLSQVFLMNRMLVFMLLPALVFLYYAPPAMGNIAIWTIALAFIAGIFLRYLRGIRITSGVLGANTIHFILYFCAVEILPTLIISKILLNV